jgi:hypothetical protein
MHPSSPKSLLVLPLEPTFPTLRPTGPWCQQVLSDVDDGALCRDLDVLLTDECRADTDRLAAARELYLAMAKDNHR